MFSSEGRSRLNSELWVQALIRQCQVAGLMAFQVIRGDRERGTILIKVCLMDGTAYLLQQATDFEGNRVWRRTPSHMQDNPPSDQNLSEKEIDEKISKERRYDPDVWVVEIEDPKNLYHHSEKIDKDL
ncbi:DUF1491 family protein [Temperatibacter marinus]|uniref:DUF1491 family protein n=1 Tax=Temperatibacter marinus TaxID=1456591 RepID=A0AA52EE08_9PROT|nr:DUF1491 family protein [Temperatibacter marinus]WND03737.1 DUF1491 family protein [Temperatibacter marinus]